MRSPDSNKLFKCRTSAFFVRTEVMSLASIMTCGHIDTENKATLHCHMSNYSNCCCSGNYIVEVTPVVMTF